MRMRSFAILTALLTVLLPAVAAAECPRYGCEAKLVQLESGGYVVQGWARVPQGWLGLKPPPAQAILAWAGGEELQRIRIRWTPIDYICCCPSEWYGEFAAVVETPIQPGDRLELVIGFRDFCATELVVPGIDEPVLSPDAYPPDELLEQARQRDRSRKKP